MERGFSTMNRGGVSEITNASRLRPNPNGQMLGVHRMIADTIPTMFRRSTMVRNDRKAYVMPERSRSWLTAPTAARRSV